ncbi:diguanylate cyclase domain-containing protein [Chitinimonas arctica]|nr:diguanylate cyclase [Chitinimonas arctica]
MNTILIITSNSADASVLKNVLSNAADGPYLIEWLADLSTALVRLGSGGIDAILVDLSLPDSSGVATFDKLFAAAPQVPILTLCDDKDELLAIEAVQHGAQGYLSKGHFAHSLVPQALRNIIQRKAVEEELFKEKSRAQIALNSITDAVICTDLSGDLNYLNKAAELLTGWQSDEVLGCAVDKVFSISNGKTGVPDPQSVEFVLQQRESVALNENTILVRQDGSHTAIEGSIAPIKDRMEKIRGVVVVFHDVSLAQAMAEKMIHLAQYDFLTDLPNRLLLNDRLNQAIILSNRNATQLAILFLDLDNFKHINDSWGHAVGDEILQSVSQRLSACVRNSDTVSRRGGDEFVILLSEIKDRGDPELIANKIIAAMAPPHAAGKGELQITTSIGISVYPADGEDGDALMRNADAAMYEAKKQGRNNYQFFS